MAAITSFSISFILAMQFNSSPKPQKLARNPNFHFPSRTTLKSSPNTNNHIVDITTKTPINKSSSKQKLQQQSDQSFSPDDTGEPKLDQVSRSNLFDMFSQLRDGFKMDELGVDILSIALPAALALAADPITSLVDTAFVGHLGSVELAAVGISVSVFNLVSKLLNVPLLNITTSFVAEEQASSSKGNDDSSQPGGRVERQGKIFLPSISTSLALAAGIGVLEAIALSFGSGSLMNIMGIPADTPMRLAAEEFLRLRAFGAPPIVVALAAQGAFRGFKDTNTPLVAIGAGNILNVILDLVLIVLFHFGIDGAAVAMVTSEYLIAIILLRELNNKVELISPNIDTRKVTTYLKSGGLLIGRTIAVLVTMTLATSLAAKEGPMQMAGYQICVEVWLAVSLLTDALALSGQALLATSYSEGNYEQARLAIYRVLQFGLVTGMGLAVILFFGFGAFSSLFTTDSEVLEIAWSGTLFVAGSQPVNAIAFVLDGLYYGVSDFAYAAYSMVLIGVISSVFILVSAPVYGLGGIWTGLFLFMALRVVAGVWRLGTRSGPWKKIWSESEKSE